MKRATAKKPNKKRLSFGVRATAVIFLCLLFSLLVCVGFAYFADAFHWTIAANIFLFGLFLVGVSAAITLVAFRLFASHIFREEQQMHLLLEEISKGNFDVQLPPTKDRYLNATVDNLNKVIEELRGIKILRNSFISDFSHEMKTPMISINGFAELLMGDVTDAERKEYATVIYDESRRLTKLAENILLLNKINAQAIVGKGAPYALDEQLRLCISQFMRELEAKKLQVECNAEPVLYTGDPDLLQQVWVNLLSNAIKYSPQGGTVTFSLAVKDGSAVVKVTDEGCGMDEETRRHAFDQFYQGDTSHSSEGNGLGLAIAHRIVELCEGSIEIVSAPDEGSTFVVTLPLSEK